MVQKFFTALTCVIVVGLFVLTVEIRREVVLQGQSLSAVKDLIAGQQVRQDQMAAQYAKEMEAYSKRAQDYDQVMQQYKEKMAEYEKTTAEYKTMMAEYQIILEESKRQQQAQEPQQ
ncbi:MAG TPA: hypothetical protein P5160_07910 [Candidatus Omnitrophota bacterium]|nr:hypothetical protein [Candidatus Omnitrophota bacterium]